MRIEVFKTAEEVAQAAAQHIRNLLDRKPGAVLALPTGSTPLGVYKLLGDVDFTRARSFNLDEYVGLEPEHPASYHAYMKKYVLAHINLPPARCHLPNGMAVDLDAECRAYEEAIKRAGGLDFAMMGIGHDGHVAFNEPPSSLACRTRVVRLHEGTRKANQVHFPEGESTPERAITMGVGTLMDARQVLLLATGAGKAEILAKALCGPVTAMVPATALQLHADPIIFCDAQAASAVGCL